jgi:hypothetical protein
VLYLAGVNEHAALSIVGNKRWRVSHLLWTIQFFRRWSLLLSNTGAVEIVQTSGHPITSKPQRDGRAGMRAL